jgi:DNA-directed RNA polymerase subunit RPC12/RpoP
MKYKPTLFPATMAVAKMGSPGWTLLTGIVEGALTVKLAQQGVPLTYSCGKPSCSGSFNLVSKVDRPLVCSECGSEIDWTGIATRKVKVCPKCGKKGNDWDTFCKFHVPAVALKVVEEPL